MVFETLQSDPNTSDAAYYAWQWLPPMAFMRATVFIVNASSRVFPIRLDNWHETPLPGVFAWLFLEWFCCLFLMYYCEKVLSVGYGVRSHPCFCVLNLPCMRGQKGVCATDKFKSIQLQQPLLATNEADAAAGAGSVPASVSSSGGPFNSTSTDVADEQARVSGESTSDYRVRVLGLRKEFAGRGGADAKVAVDGLYLGVRHNECLGLLGPNGAGKTTAISMLCGLFEPTSGGARIDGRSILDPKDLQQIHATMGVCPQHDVLWGDLTAREHLLFYGRLKGLVGANLTAEVEATLKDVKLTFAADKAAGKYSGGMKRRLSVANALVGSPRVVYLDEPSTGLDPSARRTLWDCIVAAKGNNKSIVLTTHSMEEADALCDRLAIMARGKLRCIGKAAELKKRFGAGFTFTVSVEVPTGGGSGGNSREDLGRVLAARQRAMDNFVHAELFPSAVMLDEPIAGTAQYEVRKEDVDLATLFQTLEDEATRARLFISDWAITATTLDECFLKVTRRVHAEEDGVVHRRVGRSLSQACRAESGSKSL